MNLRRSELVNETILISSLGTDDIIRQHKSACLRITALLACKDLLWIGTSAGVVLTMSLPIVKRDTMKITNIQPPIGEIRIKSTIVFELTSM